MGLKKNSKKLLHVSIIGAGYMAEEHIKALKKFKNVKILGIMSKKGISASKLSKKYKIKNVCTDIKSLYERTSVDLLIVAVTETNVKEIIIQALNYPWKIFSEKPLGLNYSESKEICQMAKILKREKDVAVGFNRRNYESTKHILSNISFKKRLIQISDQQDIYDSRVVNLPIDIKRNWMFANSIHLIDYANIFCRGKIRDLKRKNFFLDKKSKILTFSASFTSGDVLIYKALWNIPGPWSVIITNNKKSYKLEPLEVLKIKKKNSRQYEKINIKNCEKDGIKPGLYNQTMELIKFANNKKNNLCSLKDSNQVMNLTSRIYEDWKH
tara:strand:- start:3408 stop:4385 length:978 start_codon:yes stop_codon:yes gene_type:complete